MNKTDEELITAYLAGDEGAFALVVQHHLKSVYSFAFRLTGDEAEDIVQDTFLKAWKNVRRYDSSSAKFKTWLMRIARNTAIDHLRRKKPETFSHFENEQGDSPFENAFDDEPLPDELAARADDARAVQNALEKLSPLHREVILLRYMNQLSFEEIGAVLSESSNTMRSRNRRALAELRRHLEEVHQNEP